MDDSNDVCWNLQTIVHFEANSIITRRKRNCLHQQQKIRYLRRLFGRELKAPLATTTKERKNRELFKKKTLKTSDILPQKKYEMSSR